MLDFNTKLDIKQNNYNIRSEWCETNVLGLKYLRFHKLMRHSGIFYL